MEKKVSIIVPCYNGEDYIQLFISSILEQTYKNIELILINDGSTDRTEEIILNNKREIEKKEIVFKYLVKKNGGAASAINIGLKIFTGEYLIWPDCDDLLAPKSIEKRVKFLEENRSYDLVRSNIMVVDEKNRLKKIGNLFNKYSKKEDIFLDLILERTSVCSGAYMLKRKNILKNIPFLDIYESKGGQNWQIELPNTYNQKCGFIDEDLYTYVIRKNSHSHENENNLSIMIERWKEHKNILDITIKNMNITDDEKSKYLKIISQKYTRKELSTYFRLENKEKVLERYMELRDMGDLGIKTQIIFILYKLKILKPILTLKLFLKKLLKNNI